MKTNTEIVRALEHRISKIEEFMESLESRMSEPLVKDNYWKQYELHAELTAFLEWINEQRIQ